MNYGPKNIRMPFTLTLMDLLQFFLKVLELLIMAHDVLDESAELQIGVLYDVFLTLIALLLRGQEIHVGELGRDKV
jgi:hypothetical protein